MTIAVDPINLSLSALLKGDVSEKVLYGKRFPINTCACLVSVHLLISLKMKGPNLMAKQDSAYS